MKTKQFLITALVAIIFSLVTVWIYSEFSNKTVIFASNQNTELNSKFVKGSPDEDVDFTVAAEKTINAVVHVKSVMANNFGGNPFYHYFFGQQGQEFQPLSATGSGVIISDQGYIVTNNHVIEKANEIEIVLNDKRTFKAQLIGKDPSTDIALLKIDEKNLPTIPFGDSDKLKIGEWVLAVGNPFNLNSTVTAGIVSAKGRNINLLDKNYAIESFIQTDAAVNPGNSGGALVNTHGELIGINTAIASMTGSYAGYSFAVPASIVKKVVSDLIEFGTVQRGLLGVNVSDIDEKLAEKLKTDNLEGVYVSNVNENGAAKEAGILKDDIILMINDIKINKVPELQEQVSRYRPGDKIKVTIKRENKIKEIVATLKNIEGTTSFVNRNAIEILGASFTDLTEKEKKELRLKNGVKVTDVRPGKFLRIGIQEGFIITSINRIPIYSFEDIQKIVNETRGGIYIEGIYSDGSTAYYAFGLQ